MHPDSRDKPDADHERLTAPQVGEAETGLAGQIEEPPVREKAKPKPPLEVPGTGGGVTVAPQRISRRERLWITAAALAALGCLFVLLFGPRGGARRSTVGPPPASITIGQARSGDINEYVNALGTVTPIYTVTVFSQVTGRVVAVHYREGQMVKKGDPLIDIDPRPYQALLMQSEGNLRHDRALLEQARIDLKRYAAAAARNAIPRQQLDDQQQAVYQYEGAVKADEGVMAYNRVQLEYCHIVAPINGRVGLRLVDPGNTVFAGSGSTLVVITELQPITVVFNVSEDDLPEVQSELQAGAELRVDAFDRSDEHLIATGKLTSLDNQIDTTTGTLRFRAEFANDGLKLFPNQFVNARLLVRTLKGVTLIPTVALQYNGTQSFVYVVKPNHTVAVQVVKTVTSNSTDTAVEGLAPGTTVATSGFDRLEDGVAVRIRQGTPTQSATPGVLPRASQTLHPGGESTSVSSTSGSTP